MIIIALICAMAAVLIVAAWKIPGAMVTMHKNALDHRYRTMQLQDETDGHAHSRFMEMQDQSREIPAAEIALRRAEAAARQAEAEAQNVQARAELERFDSIRGRRRP
jgi:Sec-independent protein translocase protein TatA